MRAPAKTLVGIPIAEGILWGLLAYASSVPFIYCKLLLYSHHEFLFIEKQPQLPFVLGLWLWTVGCLGLRGFKLPIGLNKLQHFNAPHPAGPTLYFRFVRRCCLWVVSSHPGAGGYSSLRGA